MISKGSLIKIGIALIIAISYLLVFGISERVDASEDLEAITTPYETAEPIEEVTTSTVSNPQQADPLEISFPDYTSLNVDPLLRPFAPNGAVLLPAGYEDIITTVETSKPDVELVTGDTTTTAKPTETTADAADSTTAAQTEATTDAVTTTEENSNPSGELLRVQYSGSGGEVEVDALEILAKVVMGEIGGSFNEEAIKAQAVASYTYIKYYNKNGSAPNVTVKEPNDKVKNCVKEVFGQALYYGDELIQAVYCASSAGYTASSKTVWGVDYPYLQSRKCELESPFDPIYGVKASFTADEVKKLVKDSIGIELDGDPGNWFAIKDYVDTVYVGSISVGGKTTYTDEGGKEIEITGRTVRETIFNYQLRSSCFEVTYNGESDKFTFTTYGYGHGVGLSQNGANSLAKSWGYDYKKILNYYYPNTQLK